MSTLAKINDKKTQTAFNKKVVSASQHLHPYVKHRLYIAESTGVLPKNMYTSNGVIDESIAKFYENGYNIDWPSNTIKLKLFAFVNRELDDMYKKEAFHKDTISTNSILEEELDALDESYTVDDDWDFIMAEDLRDISYKPHDKHKHLFIYDDNDSSILNAFELEDISSDKSRKALGSLYRWLPLNVSNIVDLFVFGKLSFEEISKVKNIEINRVEMIFNEIINKFQDHVD
ncbi:hypothetical protein KO566_06345 [Flavobacteriaceae bacterium XHP0103]|uniref:hypothetical protein n=1 Tax=Marixanthotalea marina TaxID=2844359 RepID=UPI002989EFFA|nr:hypothetical protein [Marixanthotalea marina]MBU3821673.1 hypothetical protein [Marixanthotalea marina]